MELTSLEMRDDMLSKLYTLYPLTLTEYPKKMHFLALTSSLLLLYFKLDIKHQHPKTLKCSYEGRGEKCTS